jgi:hypothetical protein
MSLLKGQRILFVAPRFFGYEQDIKQELERLGAIVDWLPDRPFDIPLMKAVTVFLPQCVLPFADSLYAKLLENFAANCYDIVLVVNGQTLSKRILKSLRTSFPAAKFVLYLWDSIENRSHVRANLSLFDRLCTFDPSDAKNYGMHLRPLFYGPGFDAPQDVPMRHHISFVGTAHSDRFMVVDSLRNALPESVQAYWYLYLQAPWVLKLYRWTNPGMRYARAEDFCFVPLNKSTLKEVFASSRAILDIEHPRQTGLTMRTFETLGAGKKLVTTNAGVRDYDFYSKHNVCVIDRKVPNIPRDFLESPFDPLPKAIRRRYSIEGWLDEVLELK